MKLLNTKNYRDKVTGERWESGTEREVSAARGAELIAAGVARETGKPKRLRPEYSAGTNANVLRALMGKAGLKGKTAMKKTDMVAMLDEYWDARERAEEEAEERLQRQEGAGSSAGAVPETEENNGG